jgi:hypothetical protein
MSSVEQPKKHISYNWNDVLEWERQAKADEARIAAEAKENQIIADEAQRVKEAAAKDFREALEGYEVIEANIEIKQETVFDAYE